MLNLKHDVALKGDLRKQAGFTLIELLIVIAIIAILAAIAIPQFLKYKQGAYLDSVRSDVKNAVTAVEAYNAAHGELGTTAIDCPAGSDVGPAQCDLWTADEKNLNVSKGNHISISAPAACTNGAIGYKVEGYNNQIASGPGSEGDRVSYDSCTGEYKNF
jgi:type IV pilus assembly protein PilA